MLAGSDSEMTLLSWCLAYFCVSLEVAEESIIYLVWEGDGNASFMEGVQNKLGLKSGNLLHDDLFHMKFSTLWLIQEYICL